MTHLAVVACVAGLLLSLVGEGTDRFALRAVGKTIASLAFVAHAVLLDVPAAQPHGAWFLAAFVLSFVGDLALLGEQKPFLLGGIGAFLLAHVAYAAAFLGLAPSWVGVLVTAVPIALLGALVARALLPRAGSLAKPVVAYVVVIGAMVALAGGVAARGGPGTALALVAAVLFFVSDLFVARQRFVQRTPWNRYVGLPLYYAAQLLFGVAGAALAAPA